MRRLLKGNICSSYPAKITQISKLNHARPRKTRRGNLIEKKINLVILGNGLRINQRNMESKRLFLSINSGSEGKEAGERESQSERPIGNRKVKIWSTRYINLRESSLELSESPQNLPENCHLSDDETSCWEPFWMRHYNKREKEVKLSFQSFSFQFKPSDFKHLRSRYQT